MLLRSLLTALLSFVLLDATPVRACGPDFPPDLLSHREDSVAFLPDGAFAIEVARLVPRPPGAFAVVEAEDPPGARQGGGARERALYARGARAFRAGGYQEAAQDFAAVLALPAGERRRFSTFAAFMLGRMGPESARRFGEVRELAAAGFDDPLGLAVASYGEEGRRLLDPVAYAPAGGGAVPDRDDVGAIHLYAAQASLGSRSGAQSLLFVTRALVLDGPRLERALRDPVVQRLVTTYAWTRGGDVAWSGDPPRYPVAPLLERLAALPHLAGADRLAAAAWRAGRFDLAERFAGAEDSALASWVKAKLALRRGDRAAAERLLAEAAARTPAGERWGGDEWSWTLAVRGRLEGERAVLALARGDFAAAFERCLSSGYWEDIAYVAERVLDVDELRAVVERGTRAASPRGTTGEGGDAGWTPADPDARLRLLLARRLMREGRRREALPYFADPALATLARRYTEALDAARQGSKVDRAQALWSAASLARASGMELMGTELAPDWGWLDGVYAPGSGPDEEPPRAHPSSAASGLVTDAERRRVAAHAPAPDVRFHYRAVAADHAVAAAALVPPRSQAYAALLCHAARFVRYADPPRFHQLWRAYLDKGARVPFSDLFGERCPAPDFERARHPPPRASGSFHLPRKRTLALWGAGALGALGALALAAFAVERARRRSHRAGGVPPPP